MKKKKIVFVSNTTNFGIDVVSKACAQLYLPFVVIDDFITYQVPHAQKMIEKCGIPYYLTRMKAAILNCLEFDGPVFYVSNEMFMSNLSIFARGDCMVVYLRLTEPQFLILDHGMTEIDKEAFSARDATLCNLAHIVESDDMTFTAFVNKVLVFIQENYLKEDSEYFFSEGAEQSYQLIDPEQDLLEMNNNRKAIMKSIKTSVDRAGGPAELNPNSPAAREIARRQEKTNPGVIEAKRKKDEENRQKRAEIDNKE